MNYLKKNKKTVIAVVIFLVLVVLLGQAKKIFFPDEAKAIYGNRLEGIEKVPIKGDIEKDLKNTLSTLPVTKVSYRLSGKTIELKLTVTVDVSIDDAKSYGAKTLESFTDEQKSFYDIQIYIEKEKEDASFPIIGYKHHNEKELAWTKNRS